MKQSVNFITVATPDLDAAREFYISGLGWRPLLDVPGEIIFFQVNHGLTLGLFEAEKFVEDLGGNGAVSPAGLTLAHNVDSPEAVDRCVAAAESAGARVVKQPQKAAFGGYHGHFADPNGVLWEVCHNPGWSVDDSGAVRLGPVDG
jgi:uncharacterized protein